MKEVLVKIRDRVLSRVNVRTTIFWVQLPQMFDPPNDMRGQVGHVILWSFM